MARELNEVGVVGLGTMGAGIVEVLARAGLSVTAVEISDEAVARGRAHVEQSTDRAVSRGKLDPADRDAIFERIRFSSSLEDLASAELVIEAVPERMELKAEVFSQLDKICPPDTILATNTSSLSVTELSVVTGRPSKVIGMHFFNPAPVMKLVEVVRTVVTEPRGRRRRRGPGRAAGQGRRDHRRQGRLHRQRPAVRLPQPRRLDVREPLRQPRGHRRRHAAGLRPADGPARADGPHRHRHRLRDPRHDVQAVAQPAARAQPDHQADGHRRAARPEERPRLLHLRRARLRRGRRRRRDPGRRRCRRGRPPGADRRRRRLRHHGHRDHRGRRQGRLRRPLRRPGAGEGRGRHQGAGQVAGEAGAARPARGVRARRDPGPGHRARRRWTSWPTAT